MTFQDISGIGEMPRILRALGHVVVNDPRGFVYLYGDHGTAKSHWLWATVSCLARQGIHSVYYHAADLQEGQRQDIEGETANGELYHRVPVLAIDELDKYQFTAFSQPKLQELIDWRYRNKEEKLTILASNRVPEPKNQVDRWLPPDIVSRVFDGRFQRPWPEEFGDLPEQYSSGFIPGVIEIRGTDARRNMQPS